uniref:hypothetical protein n=1 Tax=Porodaedalea mongolica TaxID=2651638 RepID=UPI0021AC5F5C|nr:hypothetical protein NYK79_mgp07 [Porodaedalea mongolica]UUA03983.1 hypothetical protein [Porodaedalea mongolica]WCF76687.1 hypothetical protein [Porodaedalea mongolica]
MMMLNNLMCIDSNSLFFLLDFLSSVVGILDIKNYISIFCTTLGVLGVPIILLSGGKLLEHFVKGVITGSGIAVGKTATDKILKGSGTGGDGNKPTGSGNNKPTDSGTSGSSDNINNTDSSFTTDSSS